jgi:hypothetical protein
MSLLPVNNPGMNGMLGYARGQQAAPQQAPRSVQPNYGPQNAILQQYLQQSQQPPKQTSMLDRMLGLYGADPNSHIPEGRKDEARRLGMQLGVQNVQNGGNLSSMQGLTRFLQGMQQAGPAMGLMDQKQAMRDNMLAMAESGQITKPQLQAMLVQSLAMGDIDGARTLAEVIKSMGNDLIATDNPIYDPASGTWVTPPGGGATDDRKYRTGLSHPEGLPGSYQVPLDPRTGEPVWDDALLEAGPQRDPFQRWSSMRKDYEGLIKSPERAARFIQTGINSLAHARNMGEKPTGPEQINALYAFIKAIDPESVVRTGEVDLAASAASLKQRLEGIYDKWLNGESVVIPGDMPNQIEDMLRKLQVNNIRYLNEVRAAQIQGAKQWGVNENAFRDVTQSISAYSDEELTATRLGGDPFDVDEDTEAYF